MTNLFLVNIEELKEKYPDQSENINEKAGCCNWEIENRYVLADSQTEAEQLVLNGEAGLCADCMCDMMVEGKYKITS